MSLALGLRRWQRTSYFKAAMGEHSYVRLGWWGGGGDGHDITEASRGFHAAVVKVKDASHTSSKPHLGGMRAKLARPANPEEAGRMCPRDDEMNWKTGGSLGGGEEREGEKKGEKRKDDNNTTG